MYKNESDLIRDENIRLTTEVRTLRRDNKSLLLAIERILKSATAEDKTKSAYKRAQSILDKAREAKNN